MFHLFYKTGSPFLVLILFAFYVLFASPNISAQGLMKITDKIGGGGSTGETQDSGNSGTTLMIVGGVVIVGLLVYTLVLNKDKSKKEEKQDSTSDQALLPESNPAFISGTYAGNLERMQETPVNLYAGFQPINPALPEKKFVFGITCSF